MKEEFVIIKQKELTEEYLKIIAHLKMQHWNYSYELQKEWIYSNLKDEDIHVLLKVEGVYVAYLSINNINIQMEGRELICKGLGNVCVDKGYQKRGFGNVIVSKASDIIKSNNDIGILLCHEHLVKFYEKCDWFRVKYDSVQISTTTFDEILMMYNSENKYISCMKLNRNF